MIIGTAMIVSGFTAAMASRITFGLGRRVRKKTWAPMVISNRNSKIMPYMWAVGSMETMRELQSICGSASCANWMLDSSARYGIITPFEKPEVPDV